MNTPNTYLLISLAPMHTYRSDELVILKLQLLLFIFVDNFNIKMDCFTIFYVIAIFLHHVS